MSTNPVNNSLILARNEIKDYCSLFFLISGLILAGITSAAWGGTAITTSFMDRMFYTGSAALSFALIIIFQGSKEEIKNESEVIAPEEPKKATAEVVIAKKVDYSKKLYTDSSVCVLQFLDYREGIAFVRTKKDFYHDKVHHTILAAKLGWSKEDERTAAVYTQAFAQEVAQFKRYFPEQDVLGFGRQFSTEQLISVFYPIGEPSERLDLIPRFLRINTRNEPNTIVSEECARKRQICFLHAAHKGMISFMKLTIAHGASLNIGTEKYANALGQTAIRGNLRSAEFLVGLGAIVNCDAWKGQSPLYIASQNGQTAVVRFLLENGADPVQAADTGDTPIHVAKNVDTLRLLVADKPERLLKENKKGEDAVRTAKNLEVHKAAMQMLLPTKS